MVMERLSTAVEKCAETFIDAKEVAELGAMKPEGFGLLIRKRLRAESAQLQSERIYASKFMNSANIFKSFDNSKPEKNLYLSLRYNSASKECSEYLCDYGINPQMWQEADVEKRMDMLNAAVKIMSNELNLPEDLTRNIELTDVCGKDYIAEATCKIKCLNTGGIGIVGTPTFNVNTDRLTEDYYDVMSNIYQEMVHIKQYASIDSTALKFSGKSRSLGLISETKVKDGDDILDSSYLPSLYKIDAWAQGIRFKKELQTVVKNRYS